MNATIIQRVEDLPDLKALKAPVVVDTETSGLSPHHGHRICGVSVCSANDLERAWYVPVRHALVSFGEQVWESKPPDDYRNLDAPTVFAWVKRFAGDPKMTWIMHNAVFDLGMFRIEGVEFAGQIWDTMVMAHGYNSSRGSYALDSLTPGEHPWYVKLKAELARGQTFAGSGEGTKAQANYSWLPISLLGPYACEDVVSTGRLFQRMRERKDKLLAAPDNFGNPSHSQVEMLSADQELVRVLFEMQWAGVRVDLRAVLDARRDAEALAERAMAIMLECSGGLEFNAASGEERSEAFVRAGGAIRFWMLPKEARGKQKVDHFTQDKSKSTEKPCWNAIAILKYLEEYAGQHANPAYRFLVAYRRHSQLTRLISTYLDAYLTVTDPNGILHGNFHPTGTRTGRLSSRNPNLQNVTKTEDNADTKALEEHMDADLLQESDTFAAAKALPYYAAVGQGVQKKAEKSLAQRMRSFFIARPGRVLVSIDYSSVEYRVAAYLTGDPKLIGAYKQNPKLDFHQYCADLIGISRSQAKSVSFGTLYGMGDSALASMLRVPLSEAQSIRARLYAKIPAMKRLINDLKEVGRRDGQIQNPMGRVVAVSPDRTYTALNYLDQGLCGDIMRRALVKVWRLIKARGWDVIMMLTVHDEIVLDMPPALVAEAAPEIAKVMCYVPEVGLPLICDIEVGTNWGELASLESWLKEGAA